MRKLVYLTLSLLTVLLIIICNGNFNRISAETKVLKVAIEPTFPPFEMLNQETGSLEGFDIDLVKGMSLEAGFEIEFVSLPFDGIIPALQAETVDMAISAITITPQRSQTISFSRPYFKSGLAIAVRKDNQDIKGFDDLKNKKIAVQIGTTGAKKASDIINAEISTFDSFPLVLQELVNNNVDALLNDAPVTLYAIKTGNLKGIKVVSELLTEEYYGIALPKNSPYLNTINNTLLTLIENGTYQVIYQQWFAEKPPPLPATAPGLKAVAESINIGHILFNLIKGTLITLELTGFSVFLGMIGGSLMAFARISPYLILKWLSQLYVDFFRGTPLLVQIFMVYFGLPALFQGLGINVNLERLPAAVMALSLNASAYLAEIIRGGIQSIEKGQWEAARCLGMTSLQTMVFVIFPQAFRRMLPPLGNEFITILKDTSLVAVIGFEELFRQGQLIVATTYRAFEIYAAVALIYLGLTLISSKLFHWLEHWLNPIKSKN
ncbi:MAG: ABC transporter permease subunit [Crocosphaera sp.]|nr:ABC transporter permease subunit [Crocosphaera sp.]